MVLPLYIFLIIYLVFLLIWVIFSIVAVYHMLKFGFLNFTTFFIVFIYVTVAVVLLAISYNFLSQVDWILRFNPFEGLLNVKSDFFDF